MKKYNVDFSWEQKYRPKDMDSIILPEKEHRMITSMLESGTMRNLILSGNPGRGKSTLAHIIPRVLGWDKMVINASDDTSVNVFREKIKPYCLSKSSRSSKKILIIEEGEQMSDSFQKAMKDHVENTSKNMVYIISTNEPEGLNTALFDRFTEINYDFNEEQIKELIPKFKKRLRYILKEEGVVVEDRSIITNYVNLNMPDMRAILKGIQTLCIENGTEDAPLLLPKGLPIDRVKLTIDMLLDVVATDNHSEFYTFVMKYNHNRILKLVESNLDVFPKDNVWEVITAINYHDNQNRVNFLTNSNMVEFLKEIHKNTVGE